MVSLLKGSAGLVPSLVDGLVYLFATRLNHKGPTIVSPVPDTLAWETDAVSIS